MSKDLNPVSGTASRKATVSPLVRAKQVTQGLLMAAVVIFVAGAGGVYLILSKIQATQKRAADRAALADSSQEIASRYQATLDAYDQDEDQLKFLEASVAQQAFVPTLLQQLQSLAASTQLSVTSVRPGLIADTKPAAAPAAADASGAPVKRAAPPPYAIQPITVSVTGTYPQLMRFVYSLPHFPKILSLHSVNLHPDATPAVPGDPAASKGSEPKLSADIVLDAYIFNADPAPAAAPLPQPGTFSDARQAQRDVMSPTTGSVPGAAGQAAAPENASHAPMPVASPVAPQGRL